MKSRAKTRIRLREPTDWYLIPFVTVVVLFTAQAVVGELVDAGGVILGVAIGCVLLAPAVFCFVRALMQGVFISDRGLTVVNLFKTYEFDWTQVQHFEFGYPEAWIWTWSPVAVLTDGTRIQLMPIQAPQPITRSKNTFDKKAVARLEAFHAAAIENGGILPPEAIASAR